MCVTRGFWNVFRSPSQSSFDDESYFDDDDDELSRRDDDDDDEDRRRRGKDTWVGKPRGLDGVLKGVKATWFVHEV